MKTLCMGPSIKQPKYKWDDRRTPWLERLPPLRLSTEPWMGAACVVEVVLKAGLKFLVYWQNKSAAQNNRWRTPESTLHILALAGERSGAALAQNKLHHRCKKQEVYNCVLGDGVIERRLFCWAAHRERCSYSGFDF